MSSVHPVVILERLIRAQSAPRVLTIVQDVSAVAVMAVVVIVRIVAQTMVRKRVDGGLDNRVIGACSQ